MRFNIISAAMPWPLGGISLTVQPRYVVEIGSTHSASNSARSAASMGLPRSFSVAMMASDARGGAFSLRPEPIVVEVAVDARFVAR